MIKILYLISAICLTEILGLSDEMQELVDNLHKTCVAETGASEDAILDARKGVFSEDEKFKCYLKCIFDQMGCMTDDGKVDNDAVIAVLPPELQDKAAPVLAKCTDVGANACDTAWLSHRCFQKGAPDQYFLP